MYNISRYTLKTILGEPEQLASNLRHYVEDFSPKARDILAYVNFDAHCS